MAAAECLRLTLVARKWFRSLYGGAARVRGSSVDQQQLTEEPNEDGRKDKDPCKGQVGKDIRTHRHRRKGPSFRRSGFDCTV